MHFVLHLQLYEGTGCFGRCRMKDKVAKVSRSMVECYDGLMDMHGEGILEGYTHQ